MKYYDDKAGKSFEYSSLEELRLTEVEGKDYKQLLKDSGIDPFVAREGYSLPPIYLGRYNKSLYFTMMNNKCKRWAFRPKIDPILKAKDASVNKTKQKNMKKKYAVKYELKDLKKIFKFDKVRGRLLRVGKHDSIYSGGMADGNITGKVMFQGKNYDIRTLCYCFINGCDHLNARYSTIYPQVDPDDKTTSNNCWKFNLDDVKCVLPDGTEWKDYNPEVQPELNLTDTELNVESSNSSDTSTTRQEVRDFAVNPYSGIIDTGGNAITFKNIECQLEALRILATNSK